jgi:hypothetical protein
VFALEFSGLSEKMARVEIPKRIRMATVVLSIFEIDIISNI